MFKGFVKRYTWKHETTSKDIITSSSSLSTFLNFFFKIPLNYWWQILEDNLTFWIPLQPISRSSRLEIENIVLSDAFYYPLYVLSVYHIQLFALETTRECINLSDISWSFTMHFNDDKTVVDILFNGEASFHQFSLFQTDHL